MKKQSLKNLFKKIIYVLNASKTPYIVIGGIAAGVLGRPRFTEDIDLLIFISKGKVKNLLEFFKRAGFEFNRETVENTILARGIFRIFFGEFYADFFINVTEFGKKALKRAIEVELWEEKVKFPSPEDMIILKLIAGRKLDLIDAEEILLANKEKIDKTYLLKTAQEFCDEVEDLSHFYLPAGPITS